jgi:hypothetical protein
MIGFNEKDVIETQENYRMKENRDIENYSESKRDPEGKAEGGSLGKFGLLIELSRFKKISEDGWIVPPKNKL